MRIKRRQDPKLEPVHHGWRNVAIGLIALSLLLPACASDSSPTVAGDAPSVAGPTLSSTSVAGPTASSGADTSPSSSSGALATTSPIQSEEPSDQQDGSGLSKAAATTTEAASSADPIKILAVGDSITDAYGVDDTMDLRLGYSYRCKLWGKLVAEYPGVEFQFVGPVDDFPPGQTYGGVKKLVCEADVGLPVPADGSSAFSNRRAAWGGHMFHEILEHMTKPQGVSDPHHPDPNIGPHDANYLFDESSGVTFPNLSFDIALVHAGTNNIFGSRSDYSWDGSVHGPWQYNDSWEEKTYDDMRELVETLQFISSEGQILVAEIVPCNNDTVHDPDGNVLDPPELDEDGNVLVEGEVGYIYAMPGEVGTDRGGCVHVDNRDHAKGTYDLGGNSGAPGSVDSDHEGQGTIDISMHQLVGFLARDYEFDVVPMGEDFNVGIHVRDEWNGDALPGYDGVHPNDAGAEHMAAAWFSSVKPVIDRILADRSQ